MKLLTALLLLAVALTFAQAAPATLHVLFSVQQFVGFEGRYSVSGNFVLFGNVGLQGVAVGGRLFSQNVRGLYGGAGVVLRYTDTYAFAIFAGWTWFLRELSNAEFFIEGEIKIKDGRTNPDLDLGLVFKF